ncbi:MAG: CopG family transcriptional regulator [Chloroflexi bacterium]|nr:CopG family transcriptional regulator [Chloroflexota bacterium]
MKRTTISLPEDIDALVHQEARRREISVSEVAREALRAHLGLGDGHSVPYLAFVGLGRSGHHDTGEHFEEVFGAELARDPRT